MTPRARECLRLVWNKRATSKEIAAELGISKATVDGYIADAVVELGARDRRDAAAMLFGGTRAESGDDPARVVAPTPVEAPPASSTEQPPAARPWRSRGRPLNTLSLAQTIGWIAVIAIGSLAGLALAMAIGSGLPPVAMPVIEAIRRLT
ncbi:DNA-binding CsgD family transcriptional regulator [Sphingomonas jinjuensis]|uniref:DNA-binding CsgD family transcriptional regulator n=1 Tax=Sphingomonas jinjuensis TaxID=535907 RepID=A0A840FBC6_9SPHN|nr:DNA-binding CsgD family transcriptional regulator [Sphingomonas jinjuensis]